MFYGFFQTKNRAGKTVYRHLKRPKSMGRKHNFRRAKWR